MTTTGKRQATLLLSSVQGENPPTGTCSAQPRRGSQAPFSLRLTREERAILETAAAGKPVSAYIREKLFGPGASHRKARGKAPVKDHRALGQVLGALGASRLAGNLNQLAKAAHIGALPVTPEVEADLRAACNAVGEMRGALMAALGLRGGTGK